ncbi:ADP-ribosylation factor 4 [Pelomyxa schiedti]|nr:ADP-ribosylation factor 4 [Pelomyxa schiedti]
MSDDTALTAGGSDDEKQQTVTEPEPVRTLMLGLDGAGKTSLLYRHLRGAVATTIPTMGFNAEGLEIKNRKFMIWDVGGNERVRVLWRHYFANTEVILWVVDAHDRGKIAASCAELQKALSDSELRNALVLILANKNDLPDSMSKSELADMLEMSNVRNKWMIQPTSAITGMGFSEGLDWVCSNLP